MYDEQQEKLKAMAAAEAGKNCCGTIGGCANMATKPAPPSLIERLRRDHESSTLAIRRNNQLGELLYLLDKHPEVARILELMDEVGEVAMDFTRATELTPEVAAAVEDAFEYHKWDEAKIAAGKEVRYILAEAVKRIIQFVPAGPDRTVAIRKIREARMDCNSALTHEGRY